MTKEYCESQTLTVWGECIQCREALDLSQDNFTLYQADRGKHFLYCERCQSPYEPIEPVEVAPAPPRSVRFPWRELVLFMLGAVIGFWLF